MTQEQLFQIDRDLAKGLKRQQSNEHASYMEFTQVMSSWQLDFIAEKFTMWKQKPFFFQSLNCSLFHNVCAITVVLCRDTW